MDDEQLMYIYRLRVHERKAQGGDGEWAGEFGIKNKKVKNWWKTYN